jgi:hypothetical protein
LDKVSILGGPSIHVSVVAIDPGILTFKVVPFGEVFPLVALRLVLVDAIGSILTHIFWVKLKNSCPAAILSHVAAIFDINANGTFLFFDFIFYCFGCIGVEWMQVHSILSCHVPCFSELFQPKALISREVHKVFPSITGGHILVITVSDFVSTTAALILVIIVGLSEIYSTKLIGLNTPSSDWDILSPSTAVGFSWIKIYSSSEEALNAIISDSLPSERVLWS